MISADTIAGLEERKLEYILGAREHTETIARRIVLAIDDPFVPLLIERETGETQLFIKQVKIAIDGQSRRYIVCRNEAEAEWPKRCLRARAPTHSNSKATTLPCWLAPKRRSRRPTAKAA